MKQKLSVVISAFNEERKIEDCLSSVTFADEIIVVDNSSTDKTVSIVKKFTDRIYTRENNPMLNINKNFGFSKATGDWILSLDADERVTPELKKEIEELLEKEIAVNAFSIPRKNMIFGKWIRHTGWYPDRQTRLFKKGKGTFAGKHVHEMLSVDGKVEELTNDLLHENYDSMQQFLHKHVFLYAPNEADNKVKEGYIFEWRDAITFPFKEFLSRFFAREGYKDGFYGLMLSLLMAFYHFVVFAYIWEKNKFVDSKEENLVKGVVTLSEEKAKEFAYWVGHSSMEGENVVIKIKELIRKIHG